MPIKELFRALGFDKFENLPRYLAFVEELDLASYRSAIRNSAGAK